MILNEFKSQPIRILIQYDPTKAQVQDKETIETIIGTYASQLKGRYVSSRPYYATKDNINDRVMIFTFRDPLLAAFFIKRLRADDARHKYGVMSANHKDMHIKNETERHPA